MTGNRTDWVTRVISGLSAALLVAAALSGCAADPPEIGTTAARQLHASVLAVTQAASRGDVAGALAELNKLEAQLREATASGEVSAERNARIEASINLVRTDLAAALPPPAPSPSPTTGNPTQNTQSNQNGDSGGKQTGENGKRGPGKKGEGGD